LNILVIFPHPDDAALNAGGTLARWAGEGHAVTSLCCTSGNLGTLRRDQSRDELAAQRAAELEAANKVMGIASAPCLNFPDGGLLDFADLREALIRCVRQYRPDRVVTMDPWARYEVHDDHITVSKAASEAAAFACFPLLHPDQLDEGLEPHNASEVWYMGLLGDRPNTYVNIADHLGKKVEAILCFEASLGIIEGLFQHEQKTGDLASIKDRAHEWNRRLAARMGKPVGLDAAEAFITQRCAPGHFDNMDALYGKMLGEPAAEPSVIQ